jgi:C4-dicarboxylate-specific signal transduction histidine kinase
MLDALTVISVTGIVYLLMPVNTWLAIYTIKKPSTVLWCVGSFITGVAVILIGLRQELPIFWTLVVAQALLVYSFMLRGRGLQKDISSTPTSHRLITVATSIHTLVIWALLSANLIYWLDVWVRSANALVLLWFTAQIFVYARTLKSRNAMGMAFIYSLLTLAFAINMVLTWFGQSSILDHNTSPGTVFVALVAILAAIFGHINYLGVVYEGSIREMALEMSKKNRAANIQNMTHTLTRLDRQIRMGALSTSLSHAISQPLGSMMIYLRQAQKWLSPSREDRQKTKETLAKVIDETQRAADTIEEIRQFLRPAKAVVEMFDASELLRNVKVLLQHEAAQAGGQLLMKPSIEEVKIYGDKLQLTHALVSIVQAILSAQHSTNGFTIDCSSIVKDEKFIIKFIHSSLYLTEKDLKIPTMIVSQFDGIISIENDESTLVELRAPRLP